MLLIVIPRDGTYVPVNVIVPHAVNVCVCGAGVISPATAPNVIVYVPTGALVKVAAVPVPERVAGPAKENVALAMFVVTLIVPVGGGGGVTTVNPPGSMACWESGFVTVTS